jgi:hypothetical protein
MKTDIGKVQQSPVTTDTESIVLFPARILGSVVVAMTLANTTVLKKGTC